MSIANGARGKSLQGAFIQSPVGSAFTDVGGGVTGGATLTGDITGSNINPTTGSAWGYVFEDRIREGGRQAIITLDANTWNDPLSDNDKLVMFASFTSGGVFDDDLQAFVFPWNTRGGASQAQQIAAVERTSASVVTVTFPSASAYDIPAFAAPAAAKTEPVSVSVPASLHNGASTIFPTNAVSGGAFFNLRSLRETTGTVARILPEFSQTQCGTLFVGQTTIELDSAHDFATQISSRTIGRTSGTEVATNGTLLCSGAGLIFLDHVSGTHFVVYAPLSPAEVRTSQLAWTLGETVELLQVADPSN